MELGPKGVFWFTDTLTTAQLIELDVQSRHLLERIEPESFRLFCPDLADELVGCDSLTDFRLILLCCVPQHQCPLVQWKPEYPTATQQERNTMTETVTIDRPSVAKPVSRPRSRKPATVNASALALHLDCSRTYIGPYQGHAGDPDDRRRTRCLDAPWDEAKELQRPMQDDALKIVMRGVNKEDKAAA